MFVYVKSFFIFLVFPNNFLIFANAVQSNLKFQTKRLLNVKNTEKDLVLLRILDQKTFQL